jgi:extradiol dioxygenase family protein
MPPFHLAIPVHDIAAARSFYGGLFGCPEGRSSKEWVDFDFFGHQLVAHLDPRRQPLHFNPVDGKDVPVPHFGVVLEWSTWQALADRLRSGGVEFVIEPGIRFPGEVGEQATMFFYDPSGNALEFKHLLARRQLAVQRIQLILALRTERAGEAQIVAVLARPLLDPFRRYRAGMLLHDAEHDAAEVVAATAHDLERKITRELEESLGHRRYIGPQAARARALTAPVFPPAAGAAR